MGFGMALVEVGWGNGGVIPKKRGLEDTVYGASVAADGRRSGLWRRDEDGTR